MMKYQPLTPRDPAIAAEIKAIRHSCGMSLREFALAIGLTGKNANTTIWKYEHYERTPSQITLAVIRRLAPVVKTGK